MRKHSNSNGEKPCSFSRFSLRRLLYSSPLLSLRHQRSNKSSKQQASSSPETQSTCHDVEKGIEACPGTSPRVFVDTPDDPNALYECLLCCADLTLDHFPKLLTCPHRSCLDCLQQYLRIEISESRVALTCPECPEPLNPSDIHSILNDEALYEKYEDFMVRRVLSVEPDTRWCPTPDCGFAVIASGCASCPKLRCGRPGCASYFCYHCKASWHPNQTCDAARAQRSPPPLHASSGSLQNRDDLKACPRCQVLILKMDDGSCNHMTCAVCGAEFCWLCLKEISDLHYLSPSGCTFWGTKPWSRKKKILWQLGTLVGAPVGIALVAGIAIPAMIIGIPVWVGRKLYTRYEHLNKYKRNMIVTGGVVTSILIAPVLAGLAVGIGVPILLFYVYGVVPVSLCRSGGCGVSTSPSGGVRFDFDDEESIEFFSSKGSDADAVSHPNVSIGDASDKDSVSMLPLTGSIASNTRSFITQSSRGTVADESHQVRNTNDDGSSSERVRFDDNVSIIEHTPAVVTSSPRNRVSSTLRSLFFKNSNIRSSDNSSNNTCSSSNNYSSSSTSRSDSKMNRPLAPLKKGGRKLPKIPTTAIASCSKASGGSTSSSHKAYSSSAAGTRNNKKILVEVTMSDLYVPSTSSSLHHQGSSQDQPDSTNTLAHDNQGCSSCIPGSSNENQGSSSPKHSLDSSNVNKGFLSNVNQDSPHNLNQGSLASVHSPSVSNSACPYTVELGEDCLDSDSFERTPSPAHPTTPEVPPSPSAHPPKPKKLRSLENLHRGIQQHIQKRFFRSFENIALPTTVSSVVKSKH